MSGGNQPGNTSKRVGKIALTVSGSFLLLFWLNVEKGTHRMSPIEQVKGNQWHNTSDTFKPAYNHYFFHLWFTTYSKSGHRSDVSCLQWKVPLSVMCAWWFLKEMGLDYVSPGMTDFVSFSLSFFVLATKSIFCYSGYIIPLQTLSQNQCLWIWLRLQCLCLTCTPCVHLSLQITGFVWSHWLCLHGLLYFPVNLFRKTLFTWVFLLQSDGQFTVWI